MELEERGKQNTKALELGRHCEERAWGHGSGARGQATVSPLAPSET